ncbi:hypothetical protein [Cellulomonas xiejunii]|uniref:Uncharacterized protein n=1 Tax=Cellulomonas xiejunii TaxID=2968083 RepID=A0ABY5KTY9_9CELL|nr:hypothetical protein [Cellulomonas xiejunii]MCC2315591.1 hypothetical protein [Cellulomonas xiejunii]MCC2322634.1 hypothetical protein [Cellulomonas xiejunii]UUI72666.1 hypothetical protein NP048_04195 [Cellulomonas xiejunii]
MSDTSADVPTTSAVPVRENVRRGTLAALVTVPVGVAAWVLIWGLGYVTAFVGAVVAFLALRLYAWGAGRISRVGAAIVLVTTAVTLLLAFFAGIVYDGATAFVEGSGLSAWSALTHGEFWPLFFEVLPDALPDYLPDLGWALGFGALGSFAVLRSAFAAAKAQDEAPVPAAEAYGVGAFGAGAPGAEAAPAAAPEAAPAVTPAPANDHPGMAGPL